MIKRKATLEQRISRLERALRKNEGFGYRLKPGDVVEDVDGRTGVVAAVGLAGNLFKKFRSRLCDSSIDEIMDLMSEDPSWESISDCVVVCYDDTSDMDGGDCALWTDPENGLDLI